MNEYLNVLLFCINIITFLVFGYDKWQIKTIKTRFKFHLLLLTAIGGTIGGFWGIIFLNTKPINFLLFWFLHYYDTELFYCVRDQCFRKLIRYYRLTSFFTLRFESVISAANP